MPLEHVFRLGEVERVLPEGDGATDERLGEYSDDHDLTGGGMACSGVISQAEFDAHQDVYSFGAQWLVRYAGTTNYIFGGELDDPEPSGGQVQLTAKGWGALAEQTVDRFLLQSQATDQWQAGGDLGFGDGDEEIQAEVKGENLIFRVPKQTAFKRGNAGNPARWETGMYFWPEDANVRRISFTVKKEPKGDGEYTLELVTATGPDAPLMKVESWPLSGGDDNRNVLIPAGRKVVGLRVWRKDPAKKAEGRRFRITNLKVWGPITQANTFTAKQAMEYGAGLLGAVSTDIAATSTDAFPFDAPMVSLAEVFDEFGSWDGRNWTLYPDATGAKRFRAAVLGARSWIAADVHTPHKLAAANRFNRVPYEYIKAGLPRKDVATASPNLFAAGVFREKKLEAGDPEGKDKMQRLAQQVADFGVTKRTAGTATLHTVQDPANLGVDILASKVVRPGDWIVFPQEDDAAGLLSRFRVSEDGDRVECQFADTDEVLERLLDPRRKRLNVGKAPASSTPLPIGAESPAVPTNVDISFHQVRKKAGQRLWNLTVTWNPVTADIDGNGTSIANYHVWVRPYYRSSGLAVPTSDGGGWRKGVSKEGDDTESSTAETRFVFRQVEKNKEWKWKARVRAEDIVGQVGAWSGEAPGAGKATDTISPNPITTGRVKVKPTVVFVDWDAPEEADAEGQSQLDQSVAYYKVTVYRKDGPSWPRWKGPVKTRSTQKSFHANDTKDDKFKAKVVSVDEDGNVSSPVWLSELGTSAPENETPSGTPLTPGGGGGTQPPPAPTQQPGPGTGGAPHLRLLKQPWRGEVTFNYDKGTWQGQISHYEVKFQRAASPAFNAPFEVTRTVPHGPGTLQIRFTEAQQNHYHRARYRAVAAGTGATSGWGPFSNSEFAGN